MDPTRRGVRDFDPKTIKRTGRSVAGHAGGWETKGAARGRPMSLPSDGSPYRTLSDQFSMVDLMCSQNSAATAPSTTR